MLQLCRGLLKCTILRSNNFADCGESLCQGSDSLEPVRKDHERSEDLASRRSMSRIIPRQRKARAFTARFSKSLANLRQRPSQAKVLSTIHRLGKGTKPGLSSRRTISSRQQPVLATAPAVVSPW